MINYMTRCRNWSAASRTWLLKKEAGATTSTNEHTFLYYPSRQQVPVALRVFPERHINPRDPARNTASVRVPTASFEKIRLTCDFTVSGEISKPRAMRLLAKP
jgi:hypothetical protein